MFRQTNLVRMCILVFSLLGLTTPLSAWEDRKRAADHSEVKLPEIVDFLRDIKPIFDAKCANCHNPKEPTGDFDISDKELTLGGYVEAGDGENSHLYYLITSEDDDKMPPANEPQLTAAEIAVIKLWIDEGAAWPDEIPTPTTDGETSAPAEPEQREPTWLDKWKSLLGVFHPAVIHFPIALIMISAVFVVLHWIFKAGFRDAAFYCLVCGAISAPVASLIGWFYGEHEGYVGSVFDFSRDVNWHRWIGIGASVLALLVAVMAVRARKTERSAAQLIWQLGVFVVAALMGWAGHQGGELHYGHKHYAEPFNAIFMPSESKGIPNPANQPRPDSDPSDSNSKPSEDEDKKSTESSDKATTDADNEGDDSKKDDSKTGDSSTSDPDGELP